MMNTLLALLKKIMSVFTKDIPTSTNTLYQSLEYLPEIISKMNDTINITRTPWRHSLSFEQWDYPADIKNWSDEELHYELKYADCQNINDKFEPVRTMYKNVNRGQNPEENIDEWEDFDFYQLSTGMKPYDKDRGFFKSSRLNFLFLPRWGEDEITRIDIGYCREYTRQYFRIFMFTKPINISNPNDEEKEYLDILCASIELLCKALEIPTLQNGGDFTEEMIDDNALIDEFVALTKSDHNLYKKDLKDFIKYLKKPKLYYNKLVREEFFDDDTEFDKNEIIFELCREYLDVCEQDWKIDHEVLSEYISDIIQKPFSITFEETQGDPYVIATEVEIQSEYVLLNFQSGMDMYLFMLCKKEDKERLLEVSYLLDIPLEEI